MSAKMKSGITRRSLIKGAAVGAGAATLASLGMHEAKAAPPPKKWDREADVVVVGFGAGGAAAAITAHDAGSQVLILEKMPVAGGNTAVSGGIVYGANTPLQKSLGIQDSPEEMFKYYTAVGEGMLDPARVKLQSEQYGKTIEWLLGLGWDVPAKLGRPGLYISGAEEQFASVTPPKPRGHETNGTGPALFATLRKAANQRKIQTLLETEARELVANDRKEVLGLVAESRGKTIFIKARKAVILTTGGFSYSKEMKRIFKPDLLEAVSYCAPGLTGDGIRMAQDLGATLENIGNAYRVNIVAKIGPERGALILPLLLNPCLMVNKKGKRFVNEGEFYEYLVAELLKQDGKVAFAVFDEAVRKKGVALAYGFSKELNSEIQAGVVKKAETIGELSKMMGVDSAALEETVNKLNANAKQGQDPEFGRKKGLGVVETPPFYFVETRAGVGDTVGGLRTGLDAKVIDVFGKPIPRLYAAGSTTGGWMFKMYPGSGTYIGNALNFGRIAGKNAAAEKFWSKGKA